MAAVEKTLDHATARMYCDWSPRDNQFAQVLKEMPHSGHGEGVLDFAQRRVAFDEESGGRIIDGGRVYRPVGSGASAYTAYGSAAGSAPLGTPFWLLDCCLGIGGRRGRAGKPLQQEAGDEHWTRYWILFDLIAAGARALGLRDVPRYSAPGFAAEAMEGVRRPGTSAAYWALPGNVWIDERGVIRSVYVKSAGFESRMTMWAFDAPPRIERPAAAHVAGAAPA